MSDTRVGGCLCGAVRYEATVGGDFATCFCKMCQRWSAGGYFGASTADFAITQGEDLLTIHKSSEWAVRAFCSTCGSNIYYFASAHGGKSVALGTLDDTSGLTNAVQYFIDQKPESVPLVTGPKTKTKAEIAKAFGL